MKIAEALDKGTKGSRPGSDRVQDPILESFEIASASSSRQVVWG